ncbi:MAG: 6-carboxytetrahydropterin synthase [Pseudomonadales bacterium]|nr:6-carboxytetrahydropterin synthase [Pseudomonadales bacterium]
MQTTIEISKEYLHFAAAHFTIFSATERENLHGHNFHVALDATAKIQPDGLTFDYNILKDALKELCDSLDELVLMPASSPHIKIDSDDRYTYVLFADERIPFLQRDLKLLPVRNISVEELAHYLLERLTVHPDILRQDITTLVLKCASGAGQWASATWQSKESL